ncbi:hypothetical protein DFP72DRAFT_1074228 [Ephemerocybe angulata]|uniref:Uncharacterized protein n=1 Tax=Ephemerocybe angulata TaxID=980116 RepID=A0A8H6HKX3_9AGAR|nr:hypothetical protein DFP72DRAFT_1074228 [Tulosesus angulatus]
MADLNAPITLTLAQLIEMLRGANILVGQPSSKPLAPAAADTEVNVMADSLSAALKIKEDDDRLLNQYPKGRVSVSKPLDADDDNIKKDVPTVVLSDGSAFTCAHCGSHNTVLAPSETWYCITSGNRAGVVRGWHFAAPLVTGVSKAIYFKCFSKANAIRAFNEAWDGGVVNAIHGFVGVNPLG